MLPCTPVVCRTCAPRGRAQSSSRVRTSTASNTAPALGAANGPTDATVLRRHVPPFERWSVASWRRRGGDAGSSPFAGNDPAYPAHDGARATTRPACEHESVRERQQPDSARGRGAARSRSKRRCTRCGLACAHCCGPTSRRRRRDHRHRGRRSHHRRGRRRRRSRHRRHRRSRRPHLRGSGSKRATTGVGGGARGCEVRPRSVCGARRERSAHTAAGTTTTAVAAVTVAALAPAAECGEAARRAAERVCSRCQWRERARDGTAAWERVRREKGGERAACRPRGAW